MNLVNICLYMLSCIFQVPRLVKVTQADSPYFTIISPHDVGHKVGPGLPTTFRLQFTPDEIKVIDQQYSVCLDNNADILKSFIFMAASFPCKIIQ